MQPMTHENILSMFPDTADLIVRQLNCGKYTLYAYAIDGLIAANSASDYIFKPIIQELSGDSMQSLYDTALHGGIYNSVAKPCEDLEQIALMLVNGFCVVLFPDAGAIAFEVKTPTMRSIGSPEVENTVKGPKDAFVETIRTNTSLIRRHLRTPKLRLFETQVGKKSLTNVAVVWVEDVTEPELVQRIKDRLASLQIDSLISPAAVEEFVTGSRMTAFPLLQYTERTDRFCQGLLSGQVGLIVDGLPQGYLLPVDIGTLLDSPEDRSVDFVSASAIRVLRYAALLITLLLPGFYIAITIFHHEMIPLQLLRSIIESKQSVPFSTAVEVLGLLVAFELLQESGIHLPQAIGQSVSIIGGIVVGTAAVEAKLISPVALIVVSVAGVCGFVQPNRDFANALRIWRFAIAVLGAVGALFGVTLGGIGLLVHLASLKSLGTPYLAPFSEGENPGILRGRLIESERKKQT